MHEKVKHSSLSWREGWPINGNPRYVYNHMYVTFSSPNENSGSDLVTHVSVAFNTRTLVLPSFSDKAVCTL